MPERLIGIASAGRTDARLRRFSERLATARTWVDTVDGGLLVNAAGKLAVATQTYLVTTTSGVGLSGIASVSQGDLLYGSAADTFATLPKDTNATRYLANTGTDNNPAWAQVSLTTGITGTLPVANGGTNSSTALNNKRVMVSSGGAIVEAGAMSNGQLLIGSTGNSPAIAALTGTSNRVTVSNGSGTITLSGPQDIHTAASPTFASMTLSTGDLNLTAGDLRFLDAATNQHLLWINGMTYSGIKMSGTGGNILTLTPSGNYSLGVYGNSVIDQDVSTAGAPTFASESLSSGDLTFLNGSAQTIVWDSGTYQQSLSMPATSNTSLILSPSGNYTLSVTGNATVNQNTSTSGSPSFQAMQVVTGDITFNLAAIGQSVAWDGGATTQELTMPGSSNSVLTLDPTGNYTVTISGNATINQSVATGSDVTFNKLTPTTAIELGNTVPLRAADSGGTQRSMLQCTASNIVQLGPQGGTYSVTLNAGSGTHSSGGVKLTSGGTLQLNGSTTAPTSNKVALQFSDNGGDPSGHGTGSALIYNKSAEIWVIDGASNTTQISPHPEAILNRHRGRAASLGVPPVAVPWGYESNNTEVGQWVGCDMSLAMRAVETLWQEVFGRPLNLIEERRSTANNQVDRDRLPEYLKHLRG